MYGRRYFTLLLSSKSYLVLACTVMAVSILMLFDNSSYNDIDFEITLCLLLFVFSTDYRLVLVYWIGLASLFTYCENSIIL